MALSLRIATTADLDNIMMIIDGARVTLRNAGIPQWQGVYPSVDDFSNDIRNQHAYVGVLEDGRVAAVAVLFPAPDPNYDVIDGAWDSRSTGHYMSVHRFAVDATITGIGIGRQMMNLVDEKIVELGFEEVRIDTHEYNHPMQALVKRVGFDYRGIVHTVHDKTPRHAFAKWLEQ